MEESNLEQGAVDVTAQSPETSQIDNGAVVEPVTTQEVPTSNDTDNLKLNGTIKNYLNDLSIHDKQVSELKEKQAGISKPDKQKYVYVEDYGSYIDIATGKIFDEKPEDYTEPVKDNGAPDVYNLLLEQNEINRNNIQNKLVNQIYTDIDDTVENSFKDYGLSKEQIGLLKSNVTDKLVTNFKLEHGNNLPTEQDVDNLYSTVLREIELTKTMFKLNEQLQDKVNMEKTSQEPLDTKNLTGVQGKVIPQPPKNRNERAARIQEMAEQYKI